MIIALGIVAFVVVLVIGYLVMQVYDQNSYIMHLERTLDFVSNWGEEQEAENDKLKKESRLVEDNLLFCYNDLSQMYDRLSKLHAEQVVRYEALVEVNKKLEAVCEASLSAKH